jgi:hypothetical protein
MMQLYFRLSRGQTPEKGGAGKLQFTIGIHSGAILEAYAQV